MRILLVCDAFPPMRTSGALHMFDLAIELSNQGHEVVVITSDSELTKKCVESIEIFGVLIRVKSSEIKKANYYKRAIREFIQPFIMLSAFRSSNVSNFPLDGIVWYSPSIFFGLLIKLLKLKYKCTTYLVLRDLFPDWALDLGILKKGFVYRILKLIEHNQYKVADRIGVQSPGNIELMSGGDRIKSKCEVLWNWLSKDSDISKKSSIRVNETHLNGRNIFVYAGNMGVAQNVDILINLAENLQYREDVGFIFVGRGNRAKDLRTITNERKLNNVIFFDEIDPSEIPDLYSQCHVGLVALDPRHKTHNIPGKFLSYMKAGLPVLASINPGNDLIDLIESYKVGYVSSESSPKHLYDKATLLLEEICQKKEYSTRCNSILEELFSTNVAARQIISVLRN